MGFSRNGKFLLFNLKMARGQLLLGDHCMPLPPFSMILEMNNRIASHKTLGIPSLAAAPISWFCTPVTNWKSTKSEHSQKFLDLTVIFPELFQCTVLLYLNIISSLNILTSPVFAMMRWSTKLYLTA